MKSLICVIPHAAGFDSCFPLLERLHRRGRVGTRAILGPRIRATQPQVTKAFDRAGMAHRDVSVLGLELGSLRAIASADALLTHSDPLAYGKRFKLRDRAAVRAGVPTILVQHGMVQAGLHHTAGEAYGFQADLLLLWDDLPRDAPGRILRLKPGARAETVGLVKTNRLPVAPPAPEFAALLARYRQRVLICHNYGHDRTSFDDAAMARAFASFAQVFDARPDTLFVLRAHRGRRFRAHGAAIAALVADRPNVIVSDRHEGMMRFATIDEVLAVVDRVVTHPSTVVLDAVYAGRPVAMLDNRLPMLDGLPQITGADAFLRFLDDPGAGAEMLALRRRYGEIDVNLDRAAERVEAFMAA